MPAQAQLVPLNLQLIQLASRISIVCPIFGGKTKRMNITYPHTITNCIGEKLVFKSLLKGEKGGDKLLVENFVEPGCGPVMHTHWLQDEALTVLEGTIGYQVHGQPEQFASKGETVFFGRGVPHRFWNAGRDVLHCEGYVQPANSIVYFLTGIYEAQNKSGKAEPDKFDSAFLMTRYAHEFDLVEIPKLVKKAIIPITYQIGKLLGKYKKFSDAPAPVTA